MPITNQSQIKSDKLLTLCSTTIKNIERRLSSTVDAVHQQVKDMSQEQYMPQPTQNRRPVTPARPTRQAPSEPDFDDQDPFSEFSGDLDLGNLPEGEASDDPTDSDFATDGESDAELDEFGDPIDAGEQAQDPDFDETPAEEPVVLSPKLKNGEYIIVKGTVAYQIGEGDADDWVRTRTKLDTTKNVKASYDKKNHNYPVTGVEDKPGKTFVVVEVKGAYYVLTAESLLDSTTKKAAKILQPKAAEPAPKAKMASKAAAKTTTRQPELAEGTYTEDQINAINDLRVAFANFEDAFADVPATE
jgi:hypothetical protein